LNKAIHAVIASMASSFDNIDDGFHFAVWTLAITHTRVNLHYFAPLVNCF